MKESNRFTKHILKLPLWWLVVPDELDDVKYNYSIFPEKSYKLLVTVEVQPRIVTTWMIRLWGNVVVS